MDELTQKVHAVLKLFEEAEFLVKDDTCFEKLFDLFSFQSCDHGSSFTIDSERCGLMNLIRHVTENPSNYNLSVVALCVKLCSIQTPTVLVEKDLMLSLLNSIYDHKMEGDLSITVSFFYTLRKLVKEQAGLLIAGLPWAEIVHLALTILLEGKTFHLSKEARDFLICYLNTVNAAICSPLEKKVVQTVTEIIQTFSLNDRHVTVNTSLARMCVEIMDGALSVFVAGTEKTDYLLQIMMQLFSCCPSDMANITISCLLKISSEFMKDQEKVKNQLLSVIFVAAEKDIIKAQKAAEMLSNSSSDLCCEDLFTYPLNMICGSDGKSRPQFAEGLQRQMETKPACVNITCHSIHCISSLGGKSETMEALILRLFEVAVGAENKTCLDPKYRKFIHKNKKVLMKCLDASMGVMTDHCQQILICIEPLLKHQDNFMVFSKCLDCLQKCFPVMLKNLSRCTESQKSLMASISLDLQLQLCSTMWEFRDSTLNFIHKLLQKSEECRELCDWIKDSRFILNIYQSVADKESYVRASALNCLNQVLKIAELRGSLLKAINEDLEVLLEKILAVITTDSEAFPRRAAVILIVECSTLFQTESLNKRIYSTFFNVVPSDFDWEVKLGTVRLWRKLFDSAVAIKEPIGDEDDTFRSRGTCSEKSLQFDSSPAITINTLTIQGGFQALLKLSQDYDNTVRLQSLQALLDVKRRLCKPRHALLTKTPKDNFDQETLEVIWYLNDRNFETEIDLLLENYSKKRMYQSLLEDILSYNMEGTIDQNGEIDCY